ncbi:hypothetical protein PV08_01437 [Exophiala spinifera]|uniref:Large ribosomal subunit protein mL54 n=1 Tax=Exophiala spinifera TaxID=91928 RepID=A0A0D2CBE0_9EURO|nr:uncharacterized protein PV08_01437 [Exophiala spinifera]KIW20859.1 hypothetical protein PV08_01437 [Exophiala spinifera]
MICSSCRRSFLNRLRSVHIQPQQPLYNTPLSIRSVATVPSTRNAAPPQAPASISIDGVGNPTQSSNTAGKSQPLSEPHTPSTSSAKSGTGPSSTKSATSKKQQPSRPKSSVPGGAELKGLGYTKAQPKIIALEDDEYPDWLWTLLDDKKMAPGETVDLSVMTKKQRARYEKKQARLLESIPKTVPVHEQSKDITGPGDDAVTSLERRHEITKSARAARRRGIRESNFLKSM